jgi:D-aminoacyl-tRNA deacylase
MLGVGFCDKSADVPGVEDNLLYGDCRKGRRPSFDAAAPPEKARELYEYFLGKVRQKGLVTGSGIFQAHMEVELLNDGPVTLILES